MARVARSALASLRGAFRFERLPLPEAPVEAPRRPGLLHALLAPEPLAREPELPPRRRARWFRWLFVPERLDPP